MGNCVCWNTVTAPSPPTTLEGVNSTAPVAASAPGFPVVLDVAIVGAGPAGCAAALELGGRGLRVGLIEKAVPPRHKTCGGGVVGRAMALLPAAARVAVERECRVAELVHHHPGLRFICRREEPIVSMVMRDRHCSLIKKLLSRRMWLTDAVNGSQFHYSSYAGLLPSGCLPRLLGEFP